MRLIVLKCVVYVSLCRNRIRMYPALVNCTTIDWFSEWPQDALLEVADRYLDNIQFATEDEVGPQPGAPQTQHAT